MSNQTELFKQTESKETESKETCRTCKFRERWKCGRGYKPKIIQYCGVIKSNRTLNGLKKIKCKNKACGFYETEKN